MRADTRPEQLLDACLRWRHEFLHRQRGIVAHWLVGNLRGHFADMILAENREAFEAMATAHPKAPSSAAMLALLEPGSIVLRTNDVLGDPVRVPTDFACIEYGTFSPKPDDRLDPQTVLSASTKIEREYLPRYEDARGHVLARVDAETYAEIAFARTLASARSICGGYLDDPACADLLGLFDSETTELDFWYVLA